MEDIERIKRIISSEQYSTEDAVFVATYQYNIERDFEVAIKALEWLKRNVKHNDNNIIIDDTILEFAENDENGNIYKIAKRIESLQ